MNDNASKVNDFSGNPEICLTPRCPNEAETRGVCGACYQSHRRAVKNEATTWAALEIAGLILPLVPKSVATIAREEAGLTIDPNTASNEADA